MKPSISMQSLKNVLRFPFSDARWKTKFLIGSGLSLAALFLPVLPALPVLGYFARLIRAGAQNSDPSALPEWDDWGGLFMDGLRQFGALLIGLLPPSVIMFAGWFLYMGAIIAMPGLERRDSGAALLTIFSSLGIFFITFAVGMGLFLIAAVLLPAAVAHVAVTRSFGGFFAVGAWWGILRHNLLGFVAAAVVFGGLYVAMTLVTQVVYFTLVLCLLAPLLMLPLGFYSGVVFFRLIGQAYGEAEPPMEAGTLPEAVGDPVI